MSISSEILRIQGNVSDAYTAANAKGATMPVSQNSDNLASTIATIPTGSTPVIDTLNVTPTTSAQQITAPQGTDGYSPVNVSAVTSSIDANIVAGNIKKDVQILGVTGSYEGTTPTGTKQITSNGIHDVAGYANADVQVPTTAPDYYMEFTKDANNVLQSGSSVMNFSGITDIGAYVLAYAYYYNTTVTGSVDLSGVTQFNNNYSCQSAFQNASGITSVDLSNLTTVSGGYACQYMFQNCTGITSVDLSNLTTITGTSACGSMFSGCTKITGIIDLSKLTQVVGAMGAQWMFYGCSKITGVNLSGLTVINNAAQSGMSSMFQYCTSLTSVDLSNLESVTGGIGNFFASIFQGCTALTAIALPKLTTCTNAQGLQSLCSGCTSLTSVDLSLLSDIKSGNVLRWAFQGCTSLTTLSFPALASTSFGSSTTQFDNMLSGVTGCTVHFPSNLSSVIGNWASVTAGFGGTNTTILYDLPATA